MTIKRIKHNKCQTVIHSFAETLVLTAIALLLGLFSGCKNNWDPNIQFKNQILSLEEKKKQVQWEMVFQAKSNLKNLDRKLKDNIYSGLDIQSFFNLVGDRAEILARKTEGEKQWFILKYYWVDIVAQHYKPSSEEYNQCSKDKVYIEATIKDSKLISVNWL